jgi:flagellar basal-body rod modification protein FlgD
VTTQGINALSSTASSATSTSSTEKKDDALGQNAFLQLLTTQLAHQDPLQPVADTEFLAQLAQFSSLEQLTQISKQIQELSQIIKSQSADATSADATSTTGGQ